MNSPHQAKKKSSKPQRLLSIGFGDLASRLAVNLSAAGWEVTGLCRSERPAVSGATILNGDASDAAVLAPLLAQSPDQILITLTPDQRDEAAYRAAYLRPVEQLVRLCQSLAVAPHLVFVSSTAVYGQDAGEWVDESSVADATSFNGRVLRETEQVLEHRGMPVSCIRFSGIYGRRQISLAQALPSRRPEFSMRRWSNRIHVADCVGVLNFVLHRYAEQELATPLVLASDLRPVRLGAMENWMRAVLGMPRQPCAGEPTSGKRCDSRLLQRLGYDFQVADFRQGYGR